jgi:hypothetical protein
MAEAIPSPIEGESKDLLETDRLKAVENLSNYQAEMKAWRDKKVKEKTFIVRDLVLLRSPCTESSSKLEAKWDRPYLIAEKTRPGSFCLSDLEGNMLSHSWNADNLRRFYI